MHTIERYVYRQIIRHTVTLLVAIGAHGKPPLITGGTPTYEETIASTSRGDADFTWTLDGSTSEQNGLGFTTSGSIGYVSSIVPGISGQAWQSNASAVINPANNLLINTDASTVSRSISLWFRATNPDGWQNIYEEGGGTHGWHIALYSDTLTFNITQGGLARNSIQFEISPNTVYHVVAVFDLSDQSSGSNMELFVNGASVGTADFSVQDFLDSHSGDIQFGGTGDGQTLASDNGSKTPKDFEGQIQRIDYWSDKTLTSSDVVGIYNRGVDNVSSNCGKVMLAIEINDDGTYTVKPKLSRPEVFNSNSFIVGLGSSTLNGTGPSNANNQIRNLFSSYLETNSPGSEFAEIATGGYFTNRFLPDNTNDGAIRPHENATAVSGLDPDIVFVMLPSNDAANSNGNTADDYLQNQLKIKDELEKKGTFVFIQDAQPRTQFNSTEQTRLRDGADLILADAEVPLESTIRTFYTLLTEGTTAEIDPVYNSGDNIHLNDAGHILIHDEVLIPLFEGFFQVANVSTIELERSTSPASGFVVIDLSLSESGETFSRLDDQTYYFRSRIKFLDGSYSDYSNTVSIHQPIAVRGLDQTIQVNLTNAATSVSGWNIWNLSNPVAGSSISNLEDSDANSTSVGISILDNGFVNDNGVTGAGIFPDEVIGTSWRINGNDDNTPKLRIAGLSNDYAYNVRFISSEVTSEVDRRTSVYVVENDRVDGVNSGGNNGSNLITLNGLYPSGGQLTFDFRAVWATQGFVNGIIIERLGGDVVTPVELLSFESTVEERLVRLKWSTASETNNDFFLVEHSINGIDFETIGQVEGSGTTPEPQSYEYEHFNPTSGANYYQLTQVDFDGTSESHGVILATYGLSKDFILFPNPADEVLSVRLPDALLRTSGEIQVFDNSGKLLFAEQKQFTKPDLKIKVNKLLKGSYILQISNSQLELRSRFSIR